MADIIQIRRDTAANWTTANPTLAQGEMAYETDTKKFKIGDGSTAWISLAYSLFGEINPDLMSQSEAEAGTVTTERVINSVVMKAAVEKHAAEGTPLTYTPTITIVDNLDAVTAFTCQYIRSRNVITVSGRIAIDPTTSSTLTKLHISLPVASNFTSSEQCAGVGSGMGIVETCGIWGDVSNDSAEMRLVSASAGNHNIMFTFTYRIL